MLQDCVNGEWVKEYEIQNNPHSNENTNQATPPSNQNEKYTSTIVLAFTMFNETMQQVSEKLDLLGEVNGRLDSLVEHQKRVEDLLSKNLKSPEVRKLGENFDEMTNLEMK